ncbi:Putative two component system fusion protein (sensory histidine kinase and response regulator) [Aromatoleum petrolei]|nr:Putative two component system fusion protein (sensory histidine kinase and response regulator) [Aromatoleum petrolei]
MLGGRSEEQFIGREVLDFIHPEDRGIAAERIRRLNAEWQLASSIEEKLIRLDGSWFYGEVTAVPYEHQGRVGALVLFQDITARRQAEEQRDRFFALSLDLLCIAGMDGYFKRINPAFSGVLGWSEDEILARPFMALVHPDDVPATAQVMERLAAGDALQNFENRYRTKDGAWRWLEWKALPQPDGLIYATARDVTEQHDAAQRLSHMNRALERRVVERTAALDALNAKEEEIRAVVDHLLECVVRIDSRGKVVGVNPAVETIFGYRPEEVVGQNVSCLIPEPHRSQHDRYLDRYRQTGEAHIIGIGREVEGLHKDGRLIPLELSIAEYALRGEHFFIGTLRDIRERKALIAELSAARTDAEQASRAKSAFLATMSHEIRTPMNGVIGMVDVLANSRLSEHQSDLIRTIRESASALLGIIDDILDFSKIEAGRLEIERAPLSIADLVEGLCNSLVPVAARRGVELALFISPDVPERVLSDDVRLRQVLYNLVGNAIKFSAGRPDVRGRVSVRVEVAEQMPFRLAIRIADNGIGIAPETLGSLFAPFSQAEASTTRRFGGTGLGLAICRRLVDLMDGEIVVESLPGAGSRFTVTLPFEIAGEQPARALPDLKAIDCILIENADLNASDLRAYLEHAGARVFVASDERAAAEQAARVAGPAVVIAYADHRREQTSDVLKDIPNAHRLYITHGRRRRARVAGPDRVILDGDALRRQALLHAVAVAAGRASPEIVHDSGSGVQEDDEAPPPSVAEARALGRLILVAEDDEINQKVVLQQLALLGFAAEVASTGIEALRMWRNGHYALVLTDLHMPEMDGYALAEAIRREEAGRRRIPILALTANALRGEANRAHAMGMDEYLTKPIQIHVLRAALEKWLPVPRASHAAPPLTASTRAASPTPVVDVAVLRALVGDDKETVCAILGDYLVVARQQAAELQAAFADGDIRTVGALAHRLKASSRAVGAAALGDLCAELENAGRAEDREAIAHRIAQFDLILGTVLAEIAVLIEQNTS